MNRRMMEKALSQIDDRFVQESLEKMTAENKGKPKAGKYEAPGSGGLGRKFLILVLAACLVFALAAVAYAANVWGIREMFRTELRELPEAVVEDIQVHTETAAAEDWSARVTESYCDGSKILMTVEVSGGDRYVLAPTYVEPQSSIGEIGLSGEQTLEDYAREQGKELLFVGASLMQNEGLGIFTEAQNNRSPSPTEMVILVESDRSSADPVESAVCRVYATTADGTKQESGNSLHPGCCPDSGRRGIRSHRPGRHSRHHRGQCHGDQDLPGSHRPLSGDHHRPGSCLQHPEAGKPGTAEADGRRCRE